MKKYFTTNEIAMMCQVSKGSVIRWIKENKLPAAVTVGGHHRVYIDDLLVFLKSLNMVVPSDLKATGGEQKKKVLIIEDDVKLLGLLRTFFEKTFPSIEVHEAQNGFDAGLAVDHDQPELILLDLVLPMMDGFQVCQKIRSRPQWSSIKIIMMTGLQDAETKSHALELGANYFLTKPFDLDELKKIVIQELGIKGEGIERGVRKA